MLSPHELQPAPIALPSPTDTIRAYVINLASAVDRRRRMEAILDGMGIPFEVVEAVDGRTLTDADLRQFRRHDRMLLSRAEIGCLLSHVACWQRLAQSQEPFGLILEDDVHFGRDFRDCVAGLHVPRDERCVIRLETFLATVTVVREPAQKAASWGVFEMLTPHGGAAAYIVNRATAAYLLSCYREMEHAVDVELFFAGRSSIGPLTIYQVVPAPCVQDDLLNDRTGAAFLRSGLLGDRADERMGLVGPDQDDLANRAKDLLRPTYRRLVSLVLSFSGRRRLKVAYRP